MWRTLFSIVYFLYFKDFFAKFDQARLRRNLVNSGDNRRVVVYLSTAVLTLVAITHSSPTAERQVTSMSISLSMAFLISSPTSPSGHLRSSLVSPLSSMRERKSSSIPMSWKSLRFTLGTSMLCVEGQMSSSFLPVKMSRATRWTLAWPCLPVLEVDISTILQGRFLIMTKPPLRRAEHCMGKVSEAPESPWAKS